MAFDCGKGAPVSTDAALMRRLNTYFAPCEKARDFSGVVAIERQDKPVIAACYGYADFELDVPTSLAHRFGAGSVSKLFTVEALKKLKQAGKISFDDPPTRWIPNFPGGAAITLRMLAQHTAGLARGLTPSQLDTSIPHTTAQIVEACKAAKPIGAPGAGENYSDNGFRVLARVIELAAGGDYAGVVRETLFQPLGMKGTAEWKLTDVVPRLAHGYVPGNRWKSLERAIPTDLTNFRGAASFFSTANDLLLFAKSQQPSVPKKSPPPATRDHIGHDGRGHGYMATCYRYPAEQTSIVLLGNIDSGLLDMLRGNLESMVFDGKDIPPALPGESAESGPIATDMLGTYDLIGTALVLARNPDGSYFVDAGDGPSPLIAIGPDTLYSRLRFATLKRQVEAGQVVLAWSEPSGSFTLKIKQ